MVKLLSMRTRKFRDTGTILIFHVPIIRLYVETVHNFSECFQFQITYIRFCHHLVSALNHPIFYVSHYLFNLTRSALNGSNREIKLGVISI